MLPFTALTQTRQQVINFQQPSAVSSNHVCTCKVWCMRLGVSLPRRVTSLSSHTLPLLIMFATVPDVKQRSDVFTLHTVKCSSPGLKMWPSCHGDKYPRKQKACILFIILIQLIKHALVDTFYERKCNPARKDQINSADVGFKKNK